MERKYYRDKLLKVHPGDHLIMDGYPTYVVLKNLKEEDCFLAYNTDNDEKEKIKYSYVDEIHRVNSITGEISLFYFTIQGRDWKFVRKKKRGEIV